MGPQLCAICFRVPTSSKGCNLCSSEYSSICLLSNICKHRTLVDSNAVRTSGCLTLLISFGRLGLPAFPAMSKSSQVLNPCIEVVAITVHSARAGPVFLGLYNIRSDRVAAQSCYHWCKSITERRQVLFGFNRNRKIKKAKGENGRRVLYIALPHTQGFHGKPNAESA